MEVKSACVLEPQLRRSRVESNSDRSGVTNESENPPVEFASWFPGKSEACCQRKLKGLCLTENMLRPTSAFAGVGSSASYPPVGLFTGGGGRCASAVVEKDQTTPPLNEN